MRPGLHTRRARMWRHFRIYRDWKLRAAMRNFYNKLAILAAVSEKYQSYLVF